MKAHIIEPKIPPTTLKHFRTVYEKIKDNDDDMPVTFEFIMSAFFPQVYKNMKDHLRQTYDQGIKDGYKMATGKELKELELENEDSVDN